MFTNIGKKIKVLAIVITVIGILMYLVVGVLIIAESRGRDGQVFVGIAIMIIGSLMSWLSSFILYGFGQLVDNTDILVQLGRSDSMPGNNVAPINYNDVSSNYNPAPNANSTHQWRCNNCGNMINEEVCPYCSNISTNNAYNPQDEGICCPHCNKKIIIPEGVHNALCPWCNNTITL